MIVTNPSSVDHIFFRLGLINVNKCSVNLIISLPACKVDKTQLVRLVVKSADARVDESVQRNGDVALLPHHQSPRAAH